MTAPRTVFNNRYLENSSSAQISQSVFGNVYGDQHNTFVNNHPEDLLFLRLCDAIKDVGASHEAEARYPPPKCDPETREAVRKTLLEWSNPSPLICSSSFDNPRTSDLYKRPICWLNGTVGVGKSAIAQSIAEALSDQNLLVASFFFSRNSSTRNTATYLFLSIAYGLGCKDEILRTYISFVIQQHPGILSASLEKQFDLLVLKPCLERQQVGSWEGVPRVVVIDGVDECQKREDQQRVIRIIAEGVEKGFPLRFLICSRPEYAIRLIFDSTALVSITSRAKLKRDSDADKDIRRFLVKKFTDIGDRHSHYTIPEYWPTPEVIDELVNKAEGQFIYASTVVKYVDNENEDPTKQLSVILGLLPLESTEQSAPFSDLDILYHQILSCYPSYERLMKVIGFMVALPTFKQRTEHYGFWGKESFFAKHLKMNTGDLVSVFRALAAVLDQDSLQFYHASFAEFCLDRPRSSKFHIELEYHLSLIVARCIDGLVKGLGSQPWQDFTSNEWYIWIFLDKMLLAIQDTSLGQMAVISSFRGLKVDVIWNSFLSTFSEGDQFYCRPFMILLEVILHWLEDVCGEDKDVIAYFQRAALGIHFQISPGAPNAWKHCIFWSLAQIATDNPLDRLGCPFNGDNYPLDIRKLSPQFVQIVETPNHCRCFEELPAMRSSPKPTPFRKCCSEGIYFMSFSAASALFSSWDIPYSTHSMAHPHTAGCFHLWEPKEY